MHGSADSAYTANSAFGTESWANRVAAACIERYHALPRAGKPGAGEWAPLAGVVAFVPFGADISVGSPSLNDVCAENLYDDTHNAVSKGQDYLKCYSNKFNDTISLPNKTLTLISSENLSLSSNVIVLPRYVIEPLPQEPDTHRIKTPKTEVDLIEDSTPSQLPSRASSEDTSVVPQAQEMALALHGATNGMEWHQISIATPSRGPAIQRQPPPIGAVGEDNIAPREMDMFSNAKALDEATRDPETHCFETSAREPATLNEPPPIGAVGDAPQEMDLFLDAKGVASREIPTSQRRVNRPTGVASLEGGVVSRDETPPPEGVVKCVALGTGSKCLGGNELRGGGVCVHDSHAEVLARRGFLRYLLHQAERALTAGDSHVLEMGPTGCRVRPGVSFHAFVSEPPCGDAAIFPSDEHAQRVANRHSAKDHPGKRRRDVDDGDSVTAAKRISLKKRNEDIQKSSGQNESCLANATHQKAQTGPHSAFKAPDNDTKQTVNAKSSDIGKKVQDFPQKPTPTIQERTSMPESNTADVTVDEKSSDGKILQICSQAPMENAQQGIVNQETYGENSNADKKPSDAGRILQERVQKATGDAREITTTQETSATAADVHRTGAKCVGGGVQDRHAPGAGYHVTGVVRTKPGRGDPTLSLSCSDKMARWHAVGVQGALLSLLVPRPVRFRSVALAGGVSWSAGALHRALTERACADPVPLAMAQATLRSPAGRGDGARPCAAGAVWCDVPHRPHEVVARGLKQGVTKKAASTPAGRLKICRKELAKEFVRVYSLAAPWFSKRSYNKTPGLGNENLGLDSLSSDVRNLDKNVDGPVINVGSVKVAAVNSGLVDSNVLEDQCEYPRCQNGLSECKRDALDKVDVCAFKSDANICSDNDIRDKSNMCLVENEIFSSTAELSGFYNSISGDIVLGDTDCEKASKNGKSFAESLGNMTYAQLKAMARNYQWRWRHVRESHFPVWTVKPGGLQDFVVSDE